MKMRKPYLAMALVLLAVTGCVSVPAGPSVAVMPAPNKPFEVFQAEDASCRSWASSQIGASPMDTANQNTASGAIVGGAAGAALGSLSGRGTSTAFGAIAGALIGSSVGSDAGRYHGYQAQRRYDIAYQQCMYANGNMVPGARRYVRRTPPPPPDLRYSTPPDYYEPGQ